jgi:GTP pyrophosphokinase
VAKIVATEIGLGATSIACALLHDVIEDSDYTYEDLKKIFGEKIANIVNGLTKISIMNHQNISVQSENYRKFCLHFLKISGDSDQDCRPSSQYAYFGKYGSGQAEKNCFGNRLYLRSHGSPSWIYNIKSELEDLSLKYNNPEVYNEITEKLELAKESRERYIEEFKTEVSELREEGLNFKIKGRAKAISSIYRKMLKQGFPLKRFLTTMQSGSFINLMPRMKNSLPGRSIPSLPMFITVILQECVTGSPSPVLQDMKVYT